jgi:hypothetical protein
LTRTLKFFPETKILKSLLVGTKKVCMVLQLLPILTKMICIYSCLGSRHSSYSQPTNQLWAYLTFRYQKSSTRQELLSDWSIYSTVLHITVQSKINERLHDWKDVIKSRLSLCQLQPCTVSRYSKTCLMWPSKGTVKYGHIRQVVA